MIFVWINEQSHKEAFSVFLEYFKSDNNKLEILKSAIQKKLSKNEIIKRIFDYKGYEIEDDDDINEIKNMETMYISINSITFHNNHYLDNPFNSINFINQFELNDFAKNKNVDSSIVQNSLTNISYCAKKLIWNAKYKPLHLKNSETSNTNFSLDYIKSLEFVNHGNMAKILLSFIFGEYLIYLTENLSEWETLQNYITTNKMLSESKVKEISIKLLDVLKFYNQKKLYHLKIHPNYIYIKDNDVKVLFNFINLRLLTFILMELLKFSEII